MNKEILLNECKRILKRCINNDLKFSYGIYGREEDRCDRINLKLGNNKTFYIELDEVKDYDEKIHYFELIVSTENVWGLPIKLNSEEIEEFILLFNKVYEKSLDNVLIEFKSI